MTRSYSLAELARILDGKVIGDEGVEISALATLQTASSSDLSFIANPAYIKHLSTSRAGAVLIRADQIEHFSGNKLLVANPYLAYAKATVLFDAAPVPNAVIHPSAVIPASCQLGQRVTIGPQCVLGEDVVLADDVVIGAGTVIGDNSQVGARTKMAANVTIYHGVAIGEDCIFHSGCVIGADGFGFAPSADGWVKIHQLGGVIIGNKVEIGASTCVDRGALDNTVIEDGVIVDNLVQIAHNVRIGKNTAIAAHAAIAGSANIGANCTIAGAAGIIGHSTMADGVHISAMTLVSNSIREPGSYSSGTPMSNTREWRRNAARFRQLDSIVARLVKLERQKDAE